MRDLFLYIFYGAVSGFSQYTPVSSSAHQALFPMLLSFDSGAALLQLLVHSGIFCALLLLDRQRIGHLYTQMRLVLGPPKRRRRPPDADALVECRILLTAAVPALLGALLSIFAAGICVNLFVLAMALLVTGVLVYLPDYLPGGDRKSRSMSPMEAFLLGLCAAVSVLPGFSAMGLVLVVGLLRKCDRRTLLDLALLICGIWLAGMMIVDLGRLVFSGFAGVSIRAFLGSLLAGVAAFGGGVGAILTMRFLAVKTGFSGFSFLSWGLGLYSFILYLMV